MQIEILDFTRKFFYDRGVNIAPSVVAELLDALEEKFTTTNRLSAEIADKLEVFYSTRVSLTREDVHYLEAICRRLRK